MIDRPTHVKGNVLDLLLTNTSNLAQNIVIKPRNDVCSSDHFAICFDLGPAKRKRFPKRKIYNFKRANWSELNNDLKKVKWNDLLKYCDTDSAWQNFKTVLFALCDKHIPKITVQYKFKSPWYDSDTHKLCREKERLRTVYGVTGMPEDYAAFSRKRKEFKKSIEDKMRSNFEDDEDPALISKKLWSLIKNVSCTSRIPEVVNYKGKFRNNAHDQAELFNEFFCDQFSEASHYNINVDFSNDDDFELSFDHTKIAHLLKSMNAKKAQGPDGIHGHILKNCAFSIAYPLSLIYKTSYNTGCIPNEWKLGNVVPVHKKGTKSLVENYRPISLTCLVMKIFEAQIRDTLLARCQHLLDHRQHGFLPRKSCTTQLVKYIDNLSQTINDSSRADVVFFDFMKAFDSVNHDIILSKLKYKFNIDGRLLKFFVAYLQDRSQCVVINGVESGPRRVKSGVPQGSILGPLLFVLFINDMFTCVSSGTEIALYADDTKIWRRIESWEDHLALQEDINSLHSWSVYNKMKFHPLKCKVLRVTLNHIEDYRTIPLPYCIFNYSLNGNFLDFVDSEKDLGVLITTKLSWNDQCLALYSKASSRLGLVKRTCHFVNCPRQKRVLYLSLVRSIFDHASIVWRPCSENILAKLEKIQKRAVKWVLSEQDHHFSDYEYFKRLQDLDLLPIKYRFILSDLLFFHQIFHQLCTVSFPDYLRVVDDNDLNDCRLRKKVSPPDYLGAPIQSNLEELRASKFDHLSMKCELEVTKNVFENSFFIRTYSLWNRLPYPLRNMTSSNQFKAPLTELMWAWALDNLAVRPDNDVT